MVNENKDLTVFLGKIFHGRFLTDKRDLQTVSGGYGTAVDKVYVSASSVTTSTSGQIKGT